MKLLTTLLIFGGLLLVQTSLVQAQMGMMDLAQQESETSQETHIEPVEEVLADILSKQYVSTIQDLDCAQVSDNDLERLGDAVMELQHPGEAHEAMDRMMGGEGSNSLRSMHIAMGSNYLGCSNYGTSGQAYGNGYGPGMMMGRTIQDNSNWTPMMANNFQSPMMRGGWNSFGFSVLSTLGWLSVISFFISGSYFFIKKAQK